MQVPCGLAILGSHDQLNVLIPLKYILGSFPPSNSATVLQFDEVEDATQGNSEGAVNSPKVVIGGTYICAACDAQFQSKEEVTNHMEEIHIIFSQEMQDDNATLEEAAEEQDLNDLYDQFEMLYHQLKLSDKDQEPAKELAEKLVRFKAILKNKEEIYKKTQVKLIDQEKATKLLKEENKKLKFENSQAKDCEECDMQDEVVTEQTARLVERDNEVDKLKVDLNSTKKLNIKHIKDTKEHIDALNKLRNENSKLTKEKQDMKFELENKEDMIKSLKETCGIDDEALEERVDEDDEEEQEDTPEEGDDVSGPTMNKVSGNKCTACDRTFKTNQDLENHMNAKHSLKQCVLCDKVCASETDLVRHHNQCLQKGISTVACPKCNNTFTSLGLRRHKPQCKGQEAQYECSDCDKVGKSKNEIRKHISEDHAEQRVRSREVCYHWRNGHCTRGESCHFSHVGHQNSQSTHKNTTKENPCRNGQGCVWKERGLCMFYHNGVGVQKPKEVQSLQGGRQHQEHVQRTQPHRPQSKKLCRYNERCYNKSTCNFAHTPSKGFPQHSRQHRPQIVRRSNQ